MGMANECTWWFLWRGSLPTASACSDKLGGEHTSVIPAVHSPRQEEFKANLKYIVNLTPTWAASETLSQTKQTNKPTIKPNQQQKASSRVGEIAQLIKVLVTVRT